MTQLLVRQARGDSDLAAVRGLCRSYRALLADRSSDVPQFLARYYAADDFEDLLARLPALHQRPDGAIFVADLGGDIVGCAMTQKIGDQLCEIKRMFVADAARGYGAGRAIFVAAMKQAKADGFNRMVLDTTTRLGEAISLYENLGFSPIAPFHTLPQDLADHILFFGCDL